MNFTVTPCNFELDNFEPELNMLMTLLRLRLMTSHFQVFKLYDVITVPVVMMFLGSLFISISFFAIVGALCEVNE